MVVERAVVTLRGDVEVAALLLSLPKVVRKRVLRKALKAGAKPIRDRAKILTPRQRKTGGKPFKGQSPTVRMRSKIQLAAGPQTKKYARARVQLPERTLMKIKADAEHYYPAVVEYGRKRGFHGYTKPIRMMRNSLLQAQTEAENTIVSTVKREMEVEVNKLVKKFGEGKRVR